MSQYEVACYYWSNWHRTEENDRERGIGWTEWEYLKRAIPRFPGHEQPKKPIWGYLDDSQIAVMDKEINTAADYGISTFIFDWGYNPGKMQIMEAFLQAPSRSRLKFCLMFCGSMSPDTADEMIDFLVKEYFSQPNYLRVDGKCYFSMYEMGKYVAAMGGLDKMKAFLEKLNRKTVEAGLGGVHLVAVEWGLQKESWGELDPVEAVKTLGIEATTSYVWAHNTVPAWPYGTYREWSENAYECMKEIEKKYPVPYYTHVSMGWDPSPRCPETMEYYEGGPLMYHTLSGEYKILHTPYFSSIITENTPDEFELALRAAKRHMDDTDAKNKIVTLYAWNEWTEGGYLLPEARYGYGYLEAIRKVFGGEGK